jgi:hypothetical protein
MRLLSALPGQRIQSATLKAVQQHISLRYLSSGPTALTQEEIRASVNKLSQGTPFPWEQVRYILFGSFVVSIIWLRRFFSKGENVLHFCYHLLGRRSKRHTKDIRICGL